MAGIGNPKGPNAVESRPAHEITDPDKDTWFRPCTAPGANDGTWISAQDLNFFLAQLRRAIRGMGVTDDPLDDDMLLKAIQAAQFDIVAAAGNMPIFPEVKNGTNKLTVSAGTGAVVVADAQNVVFRGLITVSTTSWSLAQRTLSHAAGKTYHLRFSLAEGFSLKDLASGGYNPSARAEDHAGFDSDYDDMLVARVVTNGSNVATITPLVNAHRMATDVTEELTFNTVAAGGASTGQLGAFQTVNWARTPQVSIRKFGTRGGYRTAGVMDIGAGVDDVATDFAASRYGVQVGVQVFNPTSGSNTMYAHYSLSLLA
ncbi:hypothetical protein [Microbaculum marinisediminis]|uniref:Tail fiber protein n=1 Tax=Microbaculum marinisediminis TaxID=2931392 RepID=A0AAW5QUJ6_9HYPH|nr:hypothetical protein [Microbaculum sp. A6E488]MCT8970574.1 hypothetical protein [Microbaculum sp. A6E488]